MKMKKVLSGVLAAAMTVTAVTVTSWTISAADDIPETASLERAPKGKETVIEAFTLTDDSDNNAQKEYTGSWQYGAFVQSSGAAEEYKDDTDVYVKVSVSDVGTAGDDDTPLETIVTWENRSWAFLIQMFSEDDPAYKVNFIPTVGSTSESAVAYAPISAFPITSWGAVAGNVQSGSFSKVTLDSIELVRI